MFNDAQLLPYTSWTKQKRWMLDSWVENRVVEQLCRAIELV